MNDLTDLTVTVTYPDFTLEERQQLRQFLQSRIGAASFWRRAFAIWGYALAAGTAVWGVIMAFFFVGALFVGALANIAR